MAKLKRAAIYLRVSTDGQTVENQRRDLEAAAERHGWLVVATFADEGISGAKGRDMRPGLDALLKGASRREFDVVMAWSVDRLGRSLQHLVSFLGELHAKGVDLFLHQQGLDTSTPSGRAMCGMLSVFGEFERAMIQERVRAGLRRTVANGTRLGRPRVSAAIEARILALRQPDAEGKVMGVVKIAQTVGVGVATVQRVLGPAD